MMYLDVAGVQTYLSEIGDGSPVLFLHGVPDSADMWQPIVERMQGSYHCFAPDLPGLGRSTAPDSFVPTLDTMALYVDALVERAAIPTPLNLVAGDFGATYGLAWAVTHPAKLRRLAVVGGAGFFSDYQWHPNARLLCRPIIGELAMALTGRYGIFARSMRSSAPTLSDEHWRATYAVSFAKPSVRRMILRLYRTIDFKDFVGWEEKLIALTSQAPTLVLWGDRDPFIAPSYAERFGATRVEHFPDYGHWLAVEAPDVVAERLMSFFG